MVWMPLLCFQLMDYIWNLSQFLCGQVTLQDLEDTYNPPFKSCVIQGQSSSLMCSYNRLNGIPMCTHYELLTLTVRNSWGFNGYAITSNCLWFRSYGLGFRV
jgi:beta-glucosidase-like glycosyl hydrolase